MKKDKAFVLVCTCFLAMLHQTLSKVITGKALLTGVNTEHFLGKFSIGVGTGRVVADFWVKDIYDNPQELTVCIL